jgi:hypothetical protein
MAGVDQERQERGFIKSVNDAVKKNKGNPVTLVAGDTITGVIKASKYTGRQATGSEPYTDVVLTIKKGNKTDTLNLSLKGESAPTLAGGGLRGLELVVPGIGKKYMEAVYDYLTNTTGLNAGDKVPDVYGKITPAKKKKIVIGNAAMGGPIDYMYIGPMDVKAPYDAKTNQVNFNGTLTDSVTFASTHDLYFRLRARREDQRFDPDAKDTTGTPKVYGKSPSKGDSAGRIVITDSVPNNALIIPF